MSYFIRFTDSANKTDIEVNDNDINTTDTDLAFPGRNQRGYASVIAENFLHLLENFANDTQPLNPIEGQIWYNSTLGVQNLQVYDGSNWKAASSIYKSTSAPADPILGDLWANTTTQQLFLYNGATWILVGPTFSSGLKTGIQVEEVEDSNDDLQIIITQYINDQRVAIFSTKTFTPKSTFPGFSIIKPGLNLSTITFNSDVNATKLWGTASNSENLGGIPASTFLRSDQANATNNSFAVRSNTGISTGNEGQLQISLDSPGNIANIYHSIANSAFDIRMNKNGTKVNLIRVDATGFVGIGLDHITPDTTLHVKGETKITGTLSLTGTSYNSNDNRTLLAVSGKVTISGNLIVTGPVTMDATSIGTITLGKTGNTTAITPIADNTYDLGYSTSSTNRRRFRNIHTSTLYGNVIGDVTGNLYGNARQLLSSTTFTMSGGDVEAELFTFDGYTGGNTKNFTANVSSGFITNKLAVTDVNPADDFLLYRPNLRLMHPTLLPLLHPLPTVPVGAIFPFAGTVVPEGYLLCDGSEKRRTDYPILFGVIGYSYSGDPALLNGLNTFRLPDLRGKFALGRSTMDNGDTVNTPLGPQDSNFLAKTGALDVATETVGASGGSETKTLTVANVPEHQHLLTGDQGTQFYAYNTLPSSTTVTPTDTGAQLGFGSTAPNQGIYIDTTGDINRSFQEVSATSVDIMNPFLTINYIIFAGLET